uniref:Calmodulin n=1 Tax=Timspurckia oligopyrenoides TaxID=708627 RepID=A0A7S0ZB62_9RHOD|mmetsp:Transcript_10966/g.19822  ORF Transcript_10966/g.19822 Transcript_10966/m.19822 type:complete len:203 (+) Transcript_10966:265-873(+)|eukprot:CAMPEP_0182445080 /NCGR_PEP_ID=MMETSP1172-20130603/3334_1 /TAXON_ID=708627 /ORGANISM="Timspurckia oligopyrenoides, Strain CCMP3278" /LENGTH=202 /DNA_ID=CAMNT_0024640783 /DNA_START=282 /DNA_END=890 /DNA_ORIENTATION=-
MKCMKAFIVLSVLMLGCFFATAIPISKNVEVVVDSGLIPGVKQDGDGGALPPPSPAPDAPPDAGDDGFDLDALEEFLGIGGDGDGGDSGELDIDELEEFLGIDGAGDGDDAEAAEDASELPFPEATELPFVAEDATELPFAPDAGATELPFESATELPPFEPESSTELPPLGPESSTELPPLGPGPPTGIPPAGPPSFGFST